MPLLQRHLDKVPVERREKNATEINSSDGIITEPRAWPGLVAASGAGPRPTPMPRSAGMVASPPTQP